MTQRDAGFIMQTLYNNEIDGYSSGEQACAAWGAHSFKASEASDRYGISWLLFRVNATKFIGSVRVALKGIDIPTDQGVYSISLEKHSNSSAEYGAQQTVHNVKESELATAIDRLIEA